MCIMDCRMTLEFRRDTIDSSARTAARLLSWTRSFTVMQANHETIGAITASGALRLRQRVWNFTTVINMSRA